MIIYSFISISDGCPQHGHGQQEISWPLFSTEIY